MEGLGKLSVSMVDAGSPMVFVLAEDLGLTGIESPKEIDSNPKMLELLENIRCLAAEKMGIASQTEAREKVRAVPMVAFVSPPQAYKSHITGEEIKADDIDFVSRDMFMQIMHKTYSGTATVCTGCAAVTAGTIVNAVMRKNRHNNLVRIGHPGGVIEADMKTEESPLGIKITRAAIGRTARRIMEGYVYVPRNVLD
jgi:2-methylaconitate cis-trans-isomerase PrpF